jgi:hypothetical protein
LGLELLWTLDKIFSNVNNCINSFLSQFIWKEVKIMKRIIALILSVMILIVFAFSMGCKKAEEPKAPEAPAEAPAPAPAPEKPAEAPAPEKPAEAPKN